MLEVEENLLKWAKSQIPDLEDMTPLESKQVQDNIFEHLQQEKALSLYFQTRSEN